MNKKLVVIVVFPDCLALDVVGASDVFSCANKIINLNSKNALKGYEIIIASATEELEIVTESGLVINCKTSVYNIKEKIDTLIIGGFSSHANWGAYPAFVTWLKNKKVSIRRICSVCVGAFVLAEAGFLTDKKATTHWYFLEKLKYSYDNILVENNPIFVKDGNIYTSAGASTGIDLTLALVEEDLGRKISLQIAQSLVLYLKRPGNQSQFSIFLKHQLSDKKGIRDVQEWIMGNLKENLDVQTLSDKAMMSPRNFARVFVTETGLTPGKYIERLRVEASKKYLEETEFSFDFIAKECGLGSVETMRRIFLRTLNVSPFEYRKLFGTI
jgi:transcriptional regulator GlxA family with amidase domain